MIKKQKMHPYIILLYFLSLLCWLVIYKEPVCIILFTISLLFVSGYLGKVKRQAIMHYIIVFLILTLTNPLFVREGIDILYQNDYITITKQALIYGMVFSLMIIAVLLLYQVMQIYLTSEHILFAFAKHFSILGLVLMLVFRMLPKCRKKIKEIHDVQKVLHYQQAGIWNLLKSLKNQFLILFTWLFESSLTMYESMKARGYRHQRTHYHIFRWKSIDTIYGILIILLNVGMFFGYQQFQDFYYYPKMASITFVTSHLAIYGILILFCILPIVWKGETNVTS